MQEVVVTAQRRGENLQAVPIAVTAVTARGLQVLGVSSSQDLATISPGVIFNSAVGGGGLNIRGIGGLNAGSDEPGNAVYIDGVYQASPAALVFQFSDVDRIEVLKGPQGTLFGRNATGGVVNVITRDPSQTLRQDYEFSYGNYQTAVGDVYISAPLTSTIAASIALYGANQGEGWGRNYAPGQPTNGDWVHYGSGWGVRGKIKWVGDNGDDFILSALLTGDRPAATQGEPIIPGLLNRLHQPNPGFYNNSTDFDASETTRQETFSGTLHHSFGFAKLVSITAYDVAKLRSTVDLDNTPLPTFKGLLETNVHTFTQEFQLQSEADSKIKWLVGLFYMNSYRPLDHSILSGVPEAAVGGWADTPSRQSLNSYSGFGQVTIPITSSTDLTAGARYTEDKRHIQAWTATADAPELAPLLLKYNSLDDKTPTWHFALDQKLSENVMMYISDSRGFKSGLFNGTNPTAPAVQPQTLDAYEVGVKSEAFDHKLRINVSAFYYDFQNVQFKAFNSAGTATIYLNAGRAREPGLDIDASARPIPGLVLAAGVSLLSGKFVADPSDKKVPCYLVPTPPVGGLISVAGGCSVVGNQLPNAPHAVFTLSANYDYHATFGLISLNAALNDNSGYFFDPSNFVGAHQKAFQLLNASVVWTSLSGRYDVRFWGRNLLGEKVIGGVDLAASGGNYFPQPPLTFGLTVGAHF